ncbi:MAG: exodeoxyribonuclease VII small subunit [Dehalococcoidia bacterium]
MSKQADPQPFEAALKELEELVGRLEAGGLSLDESISLYEQGMKLAAVCQERLDSASLRITQLREQYIREEPATYQMEEDL